jgi:hypothetical protein
MTFAFKYECNNLNGVYNKYIALKYVRIFRVHIVMFSLAELTRSSYWEVKRTHEDRGPRFEDIDLTFDSIAK